MNNSIISASVSMNALQQKKLDMMANNIANVNTVGYKKKEASFQDVLTNISSQPKSFQEEGRLTPLGITHGYGSMLGAATLNMSQGAVKETGNPLDLSLEGEGCCRSARINGLGTGLWRFRSIPRLPALCC